MIDGRKIPDPFKIIHGWMEEEEGLIFWPMLTYPDIFNYLMFFPAELGSSDLSDYKLCKAYSYFKNGWLAPLLCHNLSGSKYFIFKGNCSKSMAVNEPKHKLWIIMEKEGKIKSCHCECFNGLSQTCNHVAAALYRIECAVRNGLTNPSCTSKPNKWLPGSQQLMEVPGKIKDMTFDRDDFAARGKKKRPFTVKSKVSFNPLKLNEKTPLKLSDVAAALETIAPNSIIHTATAKPEVDFFIESSAPKNDDCVICVEDVMIMSSNVEDFYANLFLHINSESIVKIENLTRGQSENEKWFQFRKGVITASKGNTIKTKMLKVKNPCGGYVDMHSINEIVSGRTYVNPNKGPLKYGRDMETDARNAFEFEIRKFHKNVVISQCGLYLLKEKPYIGGSPDGIMKCDCCGFWCIEIKCPFSINFTSPQEGKLKYLTKDSNGLLKLDANHEYFTQCQIQMGVTGHKKTFFVVWTPHGIHYEEIHFDEIFWNSLVSDFSQYYTEFYLRSIFTN